MSYMVLRMDDLDLEFISPIFLPNDPMAQQINVGTFKGHKSIWVFNFNKYPEMKQFFIEKYGLKKANLETAKI